MKIQKNDLNKSYSSGQNIISRRNQNDTVIIMKTDNANVFYKMDGIAAHLWQVFQSTVNPLNVLTALTEKFPATPAAQIEADFCAFVGQLIEIGIFAPSAEAVNPALDNVPATVFANLKDYNFGQVKEFDLAQIESEVLNESVYLDVFAGSDLRLKKDVAPLKNPLEKILSLDGISYLWNETAVGAPATSQIGLVAQQVAEVMPDLVRRDEKTGMLAINYTKITPYLVESIKQLKSMLDVQNEKIAQLESELRKLKH